MDRYSVGTIRPSQVLWTYGPGSVIDLPNTSVITMGLNRWDPDRCNPIEEARLLDAVKRILGSQVSRLRIPPFSVNDKADPHSAEGKIGIPVRPFPRWLRCVKCGLLAEYDSGLFEFQDNPYRPERSHFYHKNCVKGGHAYAVPARFLLACRNGHIDDFPWHWFVHGGHDDCRGTLRFFESGASLQTENLWVKCDDCDKARSLVHAFGSQAADNLPACRGRHPHLNSYDTDCDEQPRAVLLGATNSWFPITLSVLAIPLNDNKISQILEDGWEYFADVDSLSTLKTVIRTLRIGGTLPGINELDPEELWDAIQENRGNVEGSSNNNDVTEESIKRPEWSVLTSLNPPVEWPQFMARKTEVPSDYKDYFDDILLLERLREVNALIGFTRVEAPEESDDEEERLEMAQLGRGNPEWVPAIEVHGEGIFIRFKEDLVRRWENLFIINERNTNLEGGHRGWRNARDLDPNAGYPGIRYAMLHTFSHLLLRELALECGYNQASIKERIYASKDEESPMAGVLIYTAAADSDGTLGGLVELGKPENLNRLINQALKRASICSSDPLCSEHNPREDRSLHAAACHACTFLAETSCERGNRYLDRALLVETIECENAAYFGLGNNE